jgi:abortive infection bacteriophage resistance protein
MRPLQTSAKRFLAGTAFEDVLALYNFDRELRLLCLDAIERIEVALRAAIINELSVLHGPHFHTESRHFEQISDFKYFLGKCLQKKYLAIEHYDDKYNTPSVAPIWAMSEALTFGELSYLFAGLHRSNRKLVARQFSYDETVLVSWFKSISTLRNICAHHNRLWDFRLLVHQPKVAKSLNGEFTRGDRFYSRAVVLAAILDVVNRGSDWKPQLIDLIARYPIVDASRMGFPAAWQTRRFWV